MKKINFPITEKDIRNFYFFLSLILLIENISILKLLLSAFYGLEKDFLALFSEVPQGLDLDLPLWIFLAIFVLCLSIYSFFKNFPRWIFVIQFGFQVGFYNCVISYYDGGTVYLRMILFLVSLGQLLPLQKIRDEMIVRWSRYFFLFSYFFKYLRSGH